MLFQETTGSVIFAMDLICFLVSEQTGPGHKDQPADRQANTGLKSKVFEKHRSKAS